MPKGGAHFKSQELALALSHYKIGIIDKVRPLSSGSRHAPKMVIVSGERKFLLKRRQKGRDDLNRVAFAHAVQSHLRDNDFPVADLMETRDEKNTILQLNNYIYELFNFVEGTRYNSSVEATIDAGRQLARFHKYLADFEHESMLVQDSFHDSTTVRRHLKTVSSDRTAGQSRKLQEISRALVRLYNHSSVRVNELGFDSWTQQVVHGDWHPGNMLFSNNKLIAVLDFDSIEISPCVTDLANGMLQFSIVGNRPNPADWPGYLDQAKAIQFLNGYKEIKKLDKNKLSCLSDLMIETIIAEAVLPIAATGFFGHLSGLDFLQMIKRKAEWIDDNRKMLNETICS